MKILNIKNYHKLKFSYALLILSAIISCNRTQNNQKQETSGLDSLNVVTRKIAFVSPVPDHIYKLSEDINLQVNPVDTMAQPDSLQFLIDGVREGSVRKFSDVLSWKTKNAKAGTIYLSAIAFRGAAIIAQENISMKLYPSEPAKSYTYKIVNTYPHNTSFYTQGLVYDHGNLFESDGIYGNSALREIKIQTGEVLKEYTLPKEVFGEGIALFDNKIIQITWKEQVAFIYDKSTFELINKIQYPIKEGWGITFDGNYLLMSDGSSIIYFLNPQDMTEHRRIEVCDQNGPVLRLNELEYINDEIWANVYQTDTIVRINPKTGVVTGKINMAGLLKSTDRTNETDVLNGIAYDPTTKRIWVTGKYWPKLFQVNILPE